MTSKRPTKLKALRPGERCGIDRGIFAYKTKAREVRYGISYYVGGYRRREVVGTTVTMARHALGIRKAEIAQGRYKMKRRKQAPTFEAFADTYLADAKTRRRSWKSTRSALRGLAVFLAPKRLDEITAWDFERYRARRLEAGRTNATVNRELEILRNLLNKAVEWGHLEANPVAGVKALREDEKVMRVLSLDEERALHAAAADHLKPIIVAALNTGMRRGELLALDWDAFDQFFDVVTVKHSKSGRVRHIPVNRILKDTVHQIPVPRTGRVFKY